MRQITAKVPEKLRERIQRVANRDEEFFGPTVRRLIELGLEVDRDDYIENGPR